MTVASFKKGRSSRTKLLVLFNDRFVSLLGDEVPFRGQEKDRAVALLTYPQVDTEDHPMSSRTASG